MLITAAFVIGLASGGVLHGLATSSAAAMPVAEAPNTFAPQPEAAAPADHIQERDISVLESEVVIKVDNPVWAKFTPSGSMVPVLDASAHAIEVVPQAPEQISVGDIISYATSWSETPVIHRVIKTGTDTKGWFAIVKGDNNATADPGKVRFEQVRRLVIAIIY